jgi:N-methylhydantoinase A
MRIAIDTGGTFTDCVYVKDGKLAVLKVLSTPDDPARSVLDAVRQIARAKQVEVRHGTTIGTNALLERKGARVAFVTTEGFEDTIAIGRQARQHLYDWVATPAPCIVPAESRFGVPERVSAEGELLRSPANDDLAQLRERIRGSGAESIAISLLFSFTNTENEERLAARLRDLTLPVSVSHEILPEFREYERAATVVVNAYLAPKAGGYVQRLESSIQSEYGGSLYVMQSSGGIISGKLAATEPVRTVLSGPAGGVIGAHRVAKLAGFENIIGFDMGGTSTDVSLLDSSGPRTSSEARISDIPISVPVLDIHTVGAGGGSLAWFDRGGILHAGPASAGADPGPICYGRGEQPTVTDANLILGRLDPELTLAGTVRLDETRTRRLMDRARGPIASLEEFAAGIVRVAEAEMEKAIRLISVERGHDPREFTLVCFGGAGPLHACSLARALGIPRVLVPAMPGALSALGILMSDVVRDYSRTVMIGLPVERRASRPSEDVEDRISTDVLLEPHFADLEAKATAEFREQGRAGLVTRSADLRYAGQGYELNVGTGPHMLADFHAAHRKRYGHADESRSVEVVNVRVRMVSASDAIELPRKPLAGPSSTHAILKQKRVMFDGHWLDSPVLQRDLLSPGNRFQGPAIVHEYSATTVVLPGCKAQVDEYSNMVIEV